MKTFMNYSLNKGCKYAIVNGDYYLCTSDEQREFVLGTPQCWDDAISSKINFEQYNIYHIYSYTLEKSKVSSSVAVIVYDWRDSRVPNVFLSSMAI